MTLSMSILGGVLAISKYHHASGCPVTADLISLLEKGLPGYGQFDYRSALELALALNWIDTDDPAIAWRDRLRSLVDVVVRTTPPPWRPLVPYGRAFALQEMDADSMKCLADAGLLDDSAEAQRWWDDIAAMERAELNDLKMLIGREGERLSIEYERRRLASLGRHDLEPDWVALQNNTAGFDIRSWVVGAGTVAELNIEVKASKTSPVLIHVTRHEWQRSLASPHYVFHVWDVSERRLRVLSASEVAENAPQDRGTGEWQDFVVAINV